MTAGNKDSAPLAAGCANHLRDPFKVKMQRLRTPFVPISPPLRPPQRSRATNGTMLARVDNRTAEARRDLVAIFAAEYQIRTDADVARCETAASLKLALENQTALMCRGEKVDQGEIARLSGELRHVLSDLKRRVQGPACCEGAPLDGVNLSNVLIGDDDEEDED